MSPWKEEKMIRKRFGIIGAMELEVALLKEKLEGTTITKKAGMEFFQGRICGTDVVVVRSGVGKVNAAVCTQILADVFGVDAIINTGVAGSLDAQIDIKDLVVATDVMHHDVDATLFGYAQGEVPQLGVVSFPADEELAQLVEKAHEKAGLGSRIFRGRVVSGDQFIVSKEKKNWIRETFEASCTEMEGAAIAQAAYLNGIPFTVIRAISDKADESATMDYPTFEHQAAEQSALLLIEMLTLAGI